MVLGKVSIAAGSLVAVNVKCFGNHEWGLVMVGLDVAYLHHNELQGLSVYLILPIMG